MAFVRRAWSPHDAALGRADGVKGYHDLHFYPEARQIPGLLLYRFDAPCSSPTPTSSATGSAPGSSRPTCRSAGSSIAAEPITDVDTTAAEMLDRLEAELAERGITLAFAELKDPVKARLRRFGALERVGEDRVFPTVGTAVSGYVRASGEAWTDWEEGGEADVPR